MAETPVPINHRLHVWTKALSVVTGSKFRRDNTNMVFGEPMENRREGALFGLVRPTASKNARQEDLRGELHARKQRPRATSDRCKPWIRGSAIREGSIDIEGRNN